MKVQFKLLLILCIAVQVAKAQTESQILYSKSYETNANTTALLEFFGSSVKISESPDDKFYVEYVIDFINYPNRKKKDVIAKVNIESELMNNQITLVDKSKFSMYRFLQWETIVGSMHLKNKSDFTSYSHKPKETVLNEITEEKKPVSPYLRFIKNSNRYNENEKKKSIDRYNSRKHKKYNKIINVKVPKDLVLTINANASTIRIQDNLKNHVALRVDKGRVYVDNLNNSNNIIKIKDASLYANSINGGELILDNIQRAIIGELKNVKLNSEFSQLEIGKISSNVEITDFTSKFLIHNFSEDFGNFKMNTEYSEINLFYPKNKDYYNETFGYNTVHYINNAISKTPTQSKNKFSKMLVLGNETSPNKIKINTTHGIIRFGEDFINIEE